LFQVLSTKLPHHSVNSVTHFGLTGRRVGIFPGDDVKAFWWRFRRELCNK